MQKNYISRIACTLMALVLVCSLAALPVRASADSGLSAELSISGNGNEMNVTAAFDPEQLLGKLELNLYQDSENIASGALYVDPSAMVVESATFLDDTYGVSIPDLLDNLSASIFSPYSGSKFALDRETYEQIKSLLTAPTAPTVPAELISDELLEMAYNVGLKYSQLFAENLGGAAASQSTKELTLGGKTVSTNVTTISMDSAALKQLADAVLSAAAEDDDLAAFVAAYFDAVKVAAANAGTLSGDLADMSGEQLVSALMQSMPELIEEVDSFLEESEFQASISAYANADDGSFVRIRLDMIAYGEPAAIQCTLIGRESLSLELLGGAEDQVFMAIGMEIVEDTSNVFAVRLFAQQYSSVYDVVLSLNSKNNTYAITLNADGDTSSLMGTVETYDNEIVLTLDKINGEKLPVDVALTLRSDAYVWMPSYTEFLELDEEQVTAVLGSISNAIQELNNLF